LKCQFDIVELMKTVSQNTNYICKTAIQSQKHPLPQCEILSIYCLTSMLFDIISYNVETNSTL